MLRAVGRIIWVPLSFLVAAAFAIFVLFTLGLERVTQFMTGRGGAAEDRLVDVLDMLGQATFLITGLTIVPALIIIIVGEVARIRSALYYMAGGGLALAAIPFLARWDSGLVLPPPAVWQVFATAGFAGGGLYWLLAGRRA